MFLIFEKIRQLLRIFLKKSDNVSFDFVVTLFLTGHAFKHPRENKTLSDKVNLDFVLNLLKSLP